MQIACVDKSATDRLKLQKRLEQAYEECRSFIGHLTVAHTFPCSRDELLLRTAPDIVVLGPGFSTEEAEATCKQIRRSLPKTPILLFVAEDVFSLRTLRRFEPLTSDTFSIEEQSTRIIHKLIALAESGLKQTPGNLILVAGVKGGVGATSIVSGLAHAAHALGKSSIVIDLSKNSSLIHYLGTSRWQSPDYSSLLSENLRADEQIIRRCICTAPNGLDVLLPPAGGTEVRELWLRDNSSFEASLSIVTHLRDEYDVVLVDLAQAEGILPFALLTRASSILLLSSNDPASAYILGTELSKLSDVPRPGNLNILLNMLQPRSLSRNDVADFLQLHESYKSDILLNELVEYDRQGANWIGTGNSFYTECSRSSQLRLEQVLLSVFQSPRSFEPLPSKARVRGLLSRHRGKTSQGRKRPEHLLALPLLQGKEDRSYTSASKFQESLKIKEQVSATNGFNSLYQAPQPIDETREETQ